MTYPEAAQYLEVSVKTVRRLAAKRLITTRRPGHRTVIVDALSVERYKKRTTREAFV